MWALRDAVQAAGHYRTAVEARAFYRQLADEVDRACDAGEDTLPAAAADAGASVPP